jgi:hypothetical protein
MDCRMVAVVNYFHTQRHPQIYCSLWLTYVLYLGTFDSVITWVQTKIRTSDHPYYMQTTSRLDVKGTAVPLEAWTGPEVGRGIALLFRDLGARRWCGQHYAPAALPRERPGTHCTGGWVDPRAGLDVCEKSRPHRDSIPGPSSPWPVAMPTELSRTHAGWMCVQ